MNRNRWAPVAAAAAVIAVVAGVSLLSRDGQGTGPPVLRLAAQNTYGARDSSQTAVSGARGSYRLVGTLPSGPSEAHVRNLPAAAATTAEVRVLAAALGETAGPVRVDGAWKAGDLVVTDEPGNPWTWGAAACGPDTPVSSDGAVAKDSSVSVCNGGTTSSGTNPSPNGSSGSGSGSSTPGSSGTGSSDTGPSGASASATGSSGSVGACPSQPPGAKPVPCAEPGVTLPVPLPPEKSLVTESQAMAATARIRSALGLGGAPTRVEGLSVGVDPLAGGLPTSGMATMLQLSSQARPVGANGWLSTGREGALYPLRTARNAFDDMPVLAIGAPCSTAGCPEAPAITGARLGLSLVALDKGAAGLVPAWLFAVEGSPTPLVALAVSDEFLGGPDPTTTSPGNGPGPGTEPGAWPGTAEPGPDGSAPPAPPDTGKPAVPNGREPFGFDGAYADADPKVLVVRYGDSGSCPSLAVRHEVVELPDRVVVTLTRTPMPADQACTMDYQAKLVRVALTAPLAGREVVDGSRKEPVPISTGTPPFG